MSFCMFLENKISSHTISELFILNLPRYWHHGMMSQPNKLLEKTKRNSMNWYIEDLKSLQMIMV